MTWSQAAPPRTGLPFPTRRHTRPYPPLPRRGFPGVAPVPPAEGKPGKTRAPDEGSGSSFVPDRMLTLRDGKPVRPPRGAAALLDAAPPPALTLRGPQHAPGAVRPVRDHRLPLSRRFCCRRCPQGRGAETACGVTCWTGLLAEETRALASSSGVTVPSAAPKLELGEGVFRDRGTP